MLDQFPIDFHILKCDDELAQLFIGLDFDPARSVSEELQHSIGELFLADF